MWEWHVPKVKVNVAKDFSTVAHTLCEVEGQGYPSSFNMRQNDCTGYPIEKWLYTGKKKWGGGGGVLMTAHLSPDPKRGPITYGQDGGI